MQSKMYLIQGKFSTIPIFWEAHIEDEVIYQINDNGEISNKWQDLPIEQIKYFGMCCMYGKYGFYPYNGTLCFNGNTFKVGDSKNITENIKINETKEIYYKRKLQMSSDSMSPQTVGMEIGINYTVISLKVYPEFQVCVYFR